MQSAHTFGGGGKRATLVHTQLDKSSVERRERERALWWRTLQTQSRRYLGGRGEGKAHGLGQEPRSATECVESSALLCLFLVSTSLSLATGLHSRDLRAAVVQLDPKGISTAPTRGPKAPREQVLRVNQPHEPETPYSRQNPNQKPRSWDPIQWFSSSINPTMHPSIFACIHTCMHAYHTNRRTDGAHSSLPSHGLRTGAPFAALLPPAQPRPPPRGENSSITKGAKKRNPGLKCPAHRSFSGPPFCSAFPTPTVPSSGAVGDAPRC